MPGWCTARTTVVGVGTGRDRWVIAAVGVVSVLAAAGDVPLVTGVVLEHDVHAVRDEVVLARGVVVAWVSVSTSEDRVGTDLQVVARAQVGGQVDLVGGPASGCAGEGRTSVDGWQGHATVGVDTDGVAVGGEAVHLGSAVVALDTDGSVLDDDVGERSTGVFDPDRRTGLTGVDDAGRIDVRRAALNLDRRHFVSAGRGTEDGRRVHHVQRSTVADVEGRLGGRVPSDVSEVGVVERQRTAVLDVQVQAVGRGDRTDSGWATRGTVVVRRQEPGVLDGDDRRRGGRALNTQRTTLQLETTGVEHQVSRNRDRGVIKGERVHTVEVATEVVSTGGHRLARVERVVDQLVAVQRWVVENDRCWLKEQVQVRAPGVAVAWVPGTGQGGVGVIIGVGLVLTGRTECSDDVVLVGRTVAVFHDNPNAGVAVGVRDVAADFEEFVHAAVEQGSRNDVVGLVHLVGLSQSVNGHVGEATEVDHRRVAAGRGDVVSTVARVTAGVRTVVAVQVNVNKHHVGAAACLGHFRRTGAHARAADGRLTDGDVGVAPVNDVVGAGAVREVAVADRNRVLCGGAGTGALEGFQRSISHVHGPAAAGDGERIDVEVVHVNRFSDDGGTAHRDVFSRDAGEGTGVDTLHGDVACGDTSKHGIGTSRAVSGLGPAAWDEPEVGGTEVNVGHGKAAHGVDARVGVAVHVNVVQHHVGGRAKHRVNGHTGLSRWVGDGDVRDGDVLEVNVDEVHVGVLDGEVLSVQSTGGGTGVVHDGTSPGLSVGVTVLDRPFLQRSNGVLWEVETRLISAVNLEVFHGDNGSLAAAVGEHGTDVGEGHVAHGVVSGVTVRC